MSKSGSIQIVAELAREYGFTDVGGELTLRQYTTFWIDDDIENLLILIIFINQYDVSNCNNINGGIW